MSQQQMLLDEPPLPVIGPHGPDSTDRPGCPGRSSRGAVAEIAGPAVAAVAVAWLPFHMLGVSAPVGQVVCWAIAFVAIYGLVSWRLHGVLGMKDRLGNVYVWGGGAIALAPLLLIVWFVISQGWKVVFTDFPHFLVTNLAHTLPTDPYTKSGMYHAIIGTLEQVGLATVITAPIGVLTAVYLNEIAGRLANVVRTIVDAMSGVPSIIAGLFVYLVWVLPRGTNGYSGFAGSMAISILMVPIITRTSEEVLRIVPGSLREASLALGGTEWRTIVRVVLPTARAGLITGVILGVARGVGETAAVLFTVFGSRTTNYNPFSHPQADLPLQVLSNVQSSNQNFIDEAHGGALVLVALVLTLFTLARIIGRRSSSRVSIWRRLAETWPRATQVTDSTSE
ncbi:MAG: phosphate ABC transporter permease PstA [Acidimicrobiales bacterium]